MSITLRVKQLLNGYQGDYIMPFFWQHSENEHTLHTYMRIIHQANIRSVCVESRPHPDFLGDKWWADMDIILEEAAALNMKVWILDDQHFPTGYAAGNWIGKPDMALPWSAAMPERLEDSYGADWLSQLPYLWTKGTDAQGTGRIRVAYMDAVTRLVQDCFSDQIGQWCEQHGVAYIGHILEDCDASAGLGPSMGHFFRGLNGQHMAGIDNIGGQVLPGGQHTERRPGSMCQDDAGFYHYMLGRMGASMAAIDPKKHGRCMCENFGAYGWQTGVRTEKYLTDHFLSRGVNHFVPHAFNPGVFPDMDCPPHFYAHGENPQYRAFGDLMAYTQRVCHLIDGGQCIAPVALLYNAESIWSGDYESNILACRALTRAQISFTLIPTDALSKSSLTAEGTLCINGLHLGAIVISGCDFIPATAARFCSEALESHFPVFCTTRMPLAVCDVPAEESSRLMQCLICNQQMNSYLINHTCQIADFFINSFCPPIDR